MQKAPESHHMRKILIHDFARNHDKPKPPRFGSEWYATSTRIPSLCLTVNDLNPRGMLEAPESLHVGSGLQRYFARNHKKSKQRFEPATLHPDIRQSRNDQMECTSIVFLRKDVAAYRDVASGVGSAEKIADLLSGRCNIQIYKEIPNGSMSRGGDVPPPIHGSTAEIHYDVFTATS